MDRRGTSLGKLSVAGSAVDSFVWAIGSIGSISLGASYGSDFLVGCIPAEGDRHAKDRDDFVVPEANIKSLKIKGLRVPKGEIAPRFVLDSNFSAPTFGSVSLLNIALGDELESIGIFAYDQGTGKEIGSIKFADTITGERGQWPPRGDQVFSQQGLTIEIF